MKQHEQVDEPIKTPVVQMNVKEDKTLLPKKKAENKKTKGMGV